MKSILALITLTAASAAATCTPINPVVLTFYGYPDNDPPSADIAYDCGRGYKASGMSLFLFFIYYLSFTGMICMQRTNKTGNGTYNNPLTAASAAPGEFNKCEVLYLPYLRKYVIIEDTCAQCSMSRSLPPSLSCLIYIDIYRYLYHLGNKLTKQSKTGNKTPITWTSGPDQQTRITQKWLVARKR